MRGGLQGVRGEIHAATADHRAGVDEMSRVQKTCAQGAIAFQLAEEAFDFLGEESGFQGLQENQQG